MTVPAPLPSPPPLVRGRALWIHGDRALAWFESRLTRLLPAGTDLAAESGRLANLCLLIAVASGALLLVWYSSSLHLAYASVEAMRAGTFSGWVRALHRYSSDLVMVFLLVHAVRAFFAGKFTGARWLPWTTGVLLLGIVWLIGWTGFWLVWDQPAQLVASTAMHFLDAFPIFGEPLSRLFLADRLVPSLLFFVVFFLHMLLPLLIAVGLALHLHRLNRVRLLPARPLAFILLGVLGIAAWFMPAPLDPPARMAVIPAHLQVDAWYLTPLALALRFQQGGLWLALGGLTLLGAGLPWLLGRRFAPKADDSGVRPPAPHQTRVDSARCHACTQCVQDCPFDAVRMVPRRDGRRFSHQAWVDPTRCVGCAVCVGSCDSEAMRLPWFDALEREPLILAAVRAGSEDGPPGGPVALIAADATGGMDTFDAAVWRARLPGFQVHAVPSASWIRPKFVERLLAAGAERVLVVRDGRGESAARDGNRWIEDRLSGTRAPAFRPDRTGPGGGSWHVVDYHVSAPDEITAVAQSLRRGAKADTPSEFRVGRVVALAACLGLVLALTVGLSHLTVQNPGSPDPVWVFSFKALGEPTPSTGTRSNEPPTGPVHMRGGPTAKPRRSPVTVRLTVDGVVEERTYAAKGVSHDGPTLAVWRHRLSPGPHSLEVLLLLGPTSTPVSWQGKLEALPRHQHVLTFDPAEGFRLE